MKLDTEWALGNLAVILNILSIFLIIITALIGFDNGNPRVDIVWYLAGVYIVTIVFLFSRWVDKFNYLED